MLEAAFLFWTQSQSLRCCATRAFLFLHSPKQAWLASKQKSPHFVKAFRLRREGDSNPRDPCGSTCYPGKPIQPLLHLSKRGAKSNFISVDCSFSMQFLFSQILSISGNTNWFCVSMSAKMTLALRALAKKRLGTIFV